MADIPNFQPTRGQLISWAHMLAFSRKGKGYFVRDGYSVAAQGTPDNTVAVDYGNSFYAWALKTYNGGNKQFANCSTTLYRVDLLYLDTNGAPQIHEGENFAIVDPLNAGDWRQYVTPYIKASVPTGVILAAVFINKQTNGVPVIQNSDIWPLAIYDRHDPKPIQFSVDNGGDVIEAKDYVDVFVEYPARIKRYTLGAKPISGQSSGSCTIDIWKKDYANFPPSSGDSICGTAKPSISSNIKAQSSDLSGWSSVTLARGDWLRFNFETVTNLSRITLSLELEAI